ncbi:MAG: carbohydrate binding family 9 domain-containing protein [Bacteroidales bacterium]|nr:carbohydrate binding family 9 domain-containing protein [Bacteroidales bacterium]
MSFSNSIKFILLLLFLSLTSLLHSQQRAYQTARLTATTPQIDGILDEEAWKTASWSGGFIQRDPYDGKSPSQLTDFSILYDDNNLYIGIKAYDSTPSGIVKRLSRRDQNDGDWVAIELDSYADKLTGFAFGVTASGVKFDVMLINDVGSDDSWDPIWYVKTSSDLDGWYAEIRIPLSQIRFARKEEHNWGLQVLRYIYRKQEYSCWQPISRDATGWVSKFGELKGITGILPHRDIEIAPFAMGKAVFDEKEAGNPFQTGKTIKGTGGVDGKVSITNDFTLNFTINPDFGQVEADPSVMNLTAFETYFPEKRPFFIEGKNIFDYKLTGSDDTRNQIFYSRRIGSAPHYTPVLDSGEYASVPEETSILGSFKFSGKTRNGLSIGVIESVTSNENATIDFAGSRTKEKVEPLTSFFVTRVQKDFSKGNTQFGGIFTATNRFTEDAKFNFLTGSAYAGGFDFLHYWKNKTYYLALKSVFSLVKGDTLSIYQMQTSASHYFQRPDVDYVDFRTNRKTMSGQGGTIEAGKTGRGHWQYKTWLTWRSPGLDFNNLGYMKQADEIQQLAWIGYRYYKPFSIFRYISANLNQWVAWNFGGEVIYKGINLSSYTKFSNYWSLQLSYNLDGNNLSRAELRGGPSLLVPGGQQFSGVLATDDRKKLSFKISNTQYFGSADSYWSNIIGGGVFYKPLNSFSISFEPDFTQTHNLIQYITTRTNSEGEARYIMAHLDQSIFKFSMRASLNLTSDLSIQFYGQPFLYSGKYKDYKYITDPRASTLEDRFLSYSDDQIDYFAASDGWNYYLVDEDRNQSYDYGFYNPGLKFLQFRSNLVVRWEYKPGSTFYLVWAQGRTGLGPDNEFDLPSYTRNLFEVYPQNVLLLKLSYILIF